MRRSVVTTMSGVSLVVVGLSVRASTLGGSHQVTAGSVPVGIVAAGPASLAPAPARRTSRPRVRRTPTPVATHRVVVARTTAAATPRRTAVPQVTHSASPKPAPAPTYTVTGQAFEATAPGYNDYGPVQVQLRIQNHRIVSADAIEYPQGGRDSEINGYAIPQLDDETMQAQSAQIDSVSGATCTSQGYISSLQSAIDQAHRAGIF